MAEVAEPQNAVELEDIHVPNTKHPSSPDEDHGGGPREEPTAQVEVPVPIEELVTVPVMKLQQLVEFCAQVLRESRARESPASDLELGSLTSISSAIPIVPSKDGLDYIYTRKDFGRRNPWFTPAFVSEQSKMEMEKIWESVEGFVFDEHFATRLEFDSKRQGLSQATSVLLSCRSVADFSLLFNKSRVYGTSDFAPPKELLIGSLESPMYMAFEEENIKIMVAVCVYGAVYGAATNALGRILQGCYICGALEKPDISGRSLKAILGLSVTDLYRILYLADSDQHPAQTTDAAVGDTFRVDDLNAKALRSLGKIRVVWTLSWRNTFSWISQE